MIKIKRMKPLITLLIYMLSLSGFAQSIEKYNNIKISDDIELVRLSDNAYVHISWYTFKGFGRVACNGLIFINNNEAFLFDTPATDSLTMVLVDYFENVMKLKIKGFVPNHWHSDCIGGLGYLQKKHIESYANQITIDIAKKEKLAVPNHGFKDSLTLSLGDKLIKCYYPGPAHTLDNIAVWIPSEKILFAGCMVKSMDSKNLGNIADGDVNAYPATIGKLYLKFRSAKIVIPGHGDFGGIELIKHTRELAVIR
jgi:metallo-beta-lactamase class B